MPRGELGEYLAQLPDVIQIVSGGNVELKEPEPPEDDDDDEDV